MDIFAHSANPAGSWHRLEEHLSDVAELAGTFADKFGSRELGRWAGLWHDIGKASSRFQEFLKNAALDSERKKRGPDHSSAGTLIANQYAQILAFPIGGHHSGLSSLTELKGRILRKRDESDIKESKNTCDKLKILHEPVNSLEKFLPAFVSQKESLELYLRFMLSALVDADRLDTERHFDKEKTSIRASQKKLSLLWDAFEENQEKLSGHRTDKLNRIRHEIFLESLRAASLPPGIFRLTVPTGGGKTRSGIAFALRHALTHGLDRIIVAIPYTSIIEQTADEYRKIFGSDAVLENHSALIPPEDSETPSLEETRLLLSTENWDFPIIVTTTVQLFESLFSNRPGPCRKLHNITRSVLILDEVQTLPTDLLAPILSVLQDLVDHYGVTVVLCTATQPAFTDPNSPYLKGLRNTREIIPDSVRYFSALKRVNYHLPDGQDLWGWEDVAEEMWKTDRCMAVVNTKKDAVTLMQELGDPEALHLSTLLCGAHRREVLEKVRKLLQAGRRCRLVSTQVVEAGVDLDFPVVFRAMGPLDRIVQAAGRCNREGKLKEGGKVVIFQPRGGSTPAGAYRTGVDEAKVLLLIEKGDLHDPSIYERYFQRLYQDIDTDRWKIQDLRKKLDFPKVAENFRMIRDDSVPIMVSYGDGADLIGEIKSRNLITRNLMRHLQPYLVNIYRYRLPALIKDALVSELLPDLGLYEWRGAYDSILGITEFPRDPEDLVV